MDMADFDANGIAKGWKSEGNFNPRSFNLARILEHEFLGHGIMNLSDDPAKTAAGENEDYLGNIIRGQINVPFRSTYGEFKPRIVDGEATRQKYQKISFSNGSSLFLTQPKDIGKTKTPIK
jgi:hypothetical protein